MAELATDSLDVGLPNWQLLPMKNPLSEIMDSNGWRDTDVARRLGWHPATVSKVRRDRHVSLSLESAVRLEELTGTPARAWHYRLRDRRGSA